ncbi:uncharacterized protein EI90DRAFT_3133615 [Cantharellus anzutake]|uniref:uncharacterized protein n=1 Tax=Cantharellus anzutake TaxID=1750568 RepID=UPI001904EB4F|nr:uncharacterized protein EI90DRAFT_3133615 [Cantharellus anzutake]KAF8317833.1 hypothetical protein EI90DRAFT_3133615 [Cantharellus anzutake]
MPQLPIVGIMPIFWGLGANFDVDQHLRLPFIGAIWRQATQLQLGLFPDSAALIPEYIGWTHSEMQSVQRLFEVAGNKSADQIGILFTSQTHPELAPVKKLWKDAWKKMSYPYNPDLHSRLLELRTPTSGALLPFHHFLLADSQEVIPPPARTPPSVRLRDIPGPTPTLTPSRRVCKTYAPDSRPPLQNPVRVSVSGLSSDLGL